MPDQKISELTAITGANTADDDLFVIVDSSVGQTKKITKAELEAALALGDFTGDLTGNVTGNVTGDLTGEVDLSAISTTIASTAVDVFVYDTRKDSDGGAWRNRTQHTSWYNETLNTATRGSRKEFPAVAVIVAESTKVTIYDGDDPTLPMWMVFNYGTVGSITTMKMLYAQGTAVTALNGVICTAGNQAWKDGLVEIKFVSDTSFWRNSQNVAYWHLDIASRNVNGGYGSFVTNETEKELINNAVNDVAMTVLPSAPIDAATGLPTPTIAVATDGGVSVIKDDGTVVDITNSGQPFSIVDFIGLKLSVVNSSSGVLQIGNVPSVDVTQATFRDYFLATTTTPSLLSSPTKGSISEDSAGSLGLTRLTDLSQGVEPFASCYITSSYNTGWMHGDVKGAFLSDSSAGTVGVDETTELVTNGTFDTDTDWTKGTGWTIGSGQAVATAASGNLITTAGITTIANATYELSVDVTVTSGEVRLLVWNGSTNVAGPIAITSSGSYTLDFSTSSTSLQPYLSAIGSFTGTVDNVSLKQTGNLVVNGTFDVDTSGWTNYNAAKATVSWDAGTLKVDNTTGTGDGYVWTLCSFSAGDIIVFNATYSNTTSAAKLYFFNSGADVVGSIQQKALNGDGSVTITAVVPSGADAILVGNADTTTAWNIDNVSVRLAEEDRSVNNNGLEVHGQVTKAAVATGADLVAYSGFSADNYLQQPYNADLDFGTGDFYVMGWFKHSAQSTRKFLFNRFDKATSGAQIRLRLGTTSILESAIGATSLNTANTYDDGVWHFVCLYRSSGTAYINVDGGSEIVSTANANNVTNTSALLVFGQYITGVEAFDGGSLALWRIGAGAPTAAQIAKVYEDEKFLFQDGAQATLYGSSDAVTALAYDEDESILRVGTSAGRSDFSGLRRVSNTTTAVTTAISSVDGMVVEQ